MPNPEVLPTSKYHELTARERVTSYWHGVPSLTTLLAIAVFTPAVAGCLLLLFWLQHRRIVALGVWGFGFILLR